MVTGARSPGGSARFAVAVGVVAVSQLFMMARDVAGQTDTTPPNVSITSPASGAAVSGTVTATATATDDTGVAGVQFQLDGSPLGAEAVVAPYSIAWKTLGSSDLVFGVVKVTTGPMTISAGSGFSKRLGISCPSCSGDDTVSVDKIQSAPGAAEATFTFSTAAHYFAHMAAFKAATTPIYRQGAAATSNTADRSIGKAFGSNVAAGSLLIVAVAWSGNGSVSVTDNVNNVYTVATTAYDATLKQSLAILYAANAAAGATTITAGWNTTMPNARRIEIHEYSGLDTTSPLDTTAINSADGTTAADAVTTGTASTTVTGSVTDGSHVLTAVARDAAGNRTTSAPVTVTVTNNGAPITGDLIPPVVSITAPLPGSTVVGMTSINASATDDVGVAGVQFAVDGVNYGVEVTTPPYVIGWNSGAVANGNHTLTATARDLAGNRTTSLPVAVTVNNDTTPPVISNVTASGVTASSATISWTTNEPSDSQVDFGPTTSYGSASTLDTASVTSHTMSLSGLTDGTLYHARVRSRDAAGNLALSSDITFTTIDATAPAVSISAPASGSTLSGTITITASATDNVGVAGVQFAVDGVNVGAEVTTAPYSIPWNADAAGNGSHSLTAVARDAAGNQTTSSAVTVNVGSSADTMAPVVAITAPTGGTTISGTTTVSANASDDVGVVGVQFAIDGVNFGAEVTTAPYSVPWFTAGTTDLIFGVVKVTTGPMTINAGTGLTKRLGVSCPTCTGDDTVSVDRLQSTAGTAGATFTFSTAAHYLSHVAAFKTTATPVYVQGAATSSNSAASSLAQTFVQPTTGGNFIVAAVAWTGTAPLTVTDTQGNSYVVAATAYDATLNQTLAIVYAANVVGGATTVTAGFDTLSPAVRRLEIHEYSGIATTNPLDGTATNSADATTAVDGASGGQAPTTVISPATDGSHVVTARARDAAGNSTAASPVVVNVLNDSTPPVVSITAPAAGTTVTGMVTVTADASDNIGVVGVQFKIDGVNLGAEATTAPFSVSWNTSTASNASYTLTATARDASGNQTTSAAVAVTVNNDTTPPVISGVAASSITASNATISWTTNESSTSEVEYGVTTAYGSFSTLDTNLTTTHTETIGSLQASTVYHYRVRSKDAAGNLAVSGDFTFTTLDGTPPVVSITAPASGSTVSGTVTVTANATDNNGVAGVQFQLDGAPLGAEDVVAPYSITWNTGTAASGAHALTAVARDTSGNLATSAPVSVTVANPGQVTLAWDASAGPDLSGYKVHVGTSTGVYTASTVDVGNVTTCTLTGLQSGVAYYFAVTGYNQSGTEGGFSNEVSATP